MFERGNVKGFATQGGETGVNAWVGPNSNPGAFPDTPFVIGVAHCFGEAVQPGNIRSVDIEQLFNFAGTFNLPSGLSIAAIRGCQSIASGTTFGSGSVNEYLYGIQGKTYVQGTINAAAGFVAALFGQLDTSGASAVVTSGYVSALHLDMGATSALASTSPNFVNAETITNTTAVAVNSALKVIASLQYLFDLTDEGQGGSAWVVTSSGVSTQAQSLKVKVNGTTYYIPLCTSTT
jgi:hypothetical protein